MEKRIWNQLKKAVMITAAVGILGAGAVSAAEFEAAELYVPAVGLKQSAQWIDEEKFQAELTLEVSGLKELYKSQQENTASASLTSPSHVLFSICNCPFSEAVFS